MTQTIETKRYADYLAAARSVSPMVEAEAQAGRDAGAVTQKVVDSLLDADLAWLLVPAEWGGAVTGATTGETSIATFLDVIEEISRADASAGWSLMAINLVNGLSSSLLPEEGAKEIAGSRGLPGGHAEPRGKAIDVGDGYRVSGSWQFNSGSNFANWTASGCLVFDEAGNPLPAEQPEWIYALTPSENVTLKGGWHVGGMQGTASVDYEITDVYIPKKHVVSITAPKLHRFEPVYRVGYFGRVFAGHSACALGLIKHALEEIVRLVDNKRRLGYDGPLGESELFRYEFASHEAQYQAARAFVRQAYIGVEERLRVQDEPSAADQARMEQAAAWLHQVGKEIVGWAASWAGSATVRRPSVLGSIVDDLDVMLNHLYVDRSHLTNAGGPLAAAWRDGTVDQPISS
ncbi:MAG: Pigment production hydroxylase [Naasia sp.]|nr:Pigment production hydroxylase [Naasia sp.]